MNNAHMRPRVRARSLTRARTRAARPPPPPRPQHHHRQHAPSRGNVDAVNVHPLEFLVGEYLHLAAVVALAWALPGGVHVAAAAAFVVLGGLGASLNHTRLDVRVPRAAAGEGGGGWLYDVRAHDVHHRLPRSNYGQYTMAWDRLFGTYRPYDGPGAAAPPRKGKAGGD